MPKAALAAVVIAYSIDLIHPKDFREGVTLCLAALNGDAMAVVERSHLRQDLGPGRLFFNLEAAVEAHASRAPRRADAPRPA